jgi:alpha-1,6-mannosyltransferase
MLKQRPIYYVWVFISVLCYSLIAFFIHRWQTSYLLPTYGVLFLIYLLIIKEAKPEQLSFWLTISVLFRFIFLFALPTLSEDFYRFIWDGRLWNSGFHPFAELPEAYLEQGITGIDQELFSRLNSPEYFTIYPPVSQFIFWLSVKVSPSSVLGSVVFMRLILLAGEVGVIVLMRRLLSQFSMPSTNTLLYALNPLVIIELTGNLHFEGLVLFFILLTVYALGKQIIVQSAASIALATATKLVPIIFLPALLRAQGFKGSVKYGVLFIIFLALFFLPLFNYQVFQSLTTSVGLYFNKFEFNASLYYLVREYGFWKYGYNIIQTVGWKLGVVTTMLIVLFTFRKGWTKSDVISIDSTQFLLSDFLWILSIYFLFATTLHPWYITTLLALSVFTPYRFTLVWTGLIFFTYAGYSINSFKENLGLIAFEYLAVIGYLIFELKKRGVFNLLFKKREN